MKRSSAGLLAVCLLAGCEAEPYVPPTVDVPGMPSPEAALQASLARVGAKMAELGGMAPSAAAPRPAPLLPDDLTRTIYFRFRGRLDDAVRELAGNVGYSVQIEKPRSGADLRVAIEVLDFRIVDVLRALGEQMGTRATVEVDPLHHQIRVIHHV
jgi:defect in organelle trafficking protein DotD